MYSVSKSSDFYSRHLAKFRYHVVIYKVYCLEEYSGYNHVQILVYRIFFLNKLTM